MDWILLIPLILPVGVGLFCSLVHNRKLIEAFACIGTLLTFFLTLRILFLGNLRLQIEWINLPDVQIPFDLISYHFSAIILCACSFFGLLITIYSIEQMKEKSGLKKYYIYLLWTIGFANGAVLSNNWVVLLLFWGMIAIMLYLLISISGTIAEKAARKSFIIIGCSDFLMLLGIMIIWHLTNTMNLNEITIPIKGGWSATAFILLMIGALAKAGAMPLHSWIPDAAEVAPIPVMAFLPAALDKLLGIYLLIRLTLDAFVIDISIKMILMTIGAITIIAAVMMALIQKDLKKLLSFHAISQVGYMVLGIGTGTLFGIAGGLFHMFNNVIYKCCLFLCACAVEHRTKTTNLEKLGGLAKGMPVTFITCTVAAFSISGIPPLNGFVSKWMIYQGIIDMGSSIYPIFLIIAMFGSVLTLASFVKVLHSVFMGEKPKEISDVNEVGFSMKIPLIILALLCIIFGVWAQFPLESIIGPVLGTHFSGFIDTINLSGMWNPTLATILLLSSLLCGIGLYRIGNIKSAKEGDIFVGGEPIDHEELRIPGTHFYETIESFKFLDWLYSKAKIRTFDLYEWGKKSIKIVSSALYYGIDRLIDRFYISIETWIQSLSHGVKKLHSGNLTTYLLWFCIGVSILFFILMK